MESSNWWRDITADQLPDWVNQLQATHRRIIGSNTSGKPGAVTDIDYTFRADSSGRPSKTASDPESGRDPPNQETTDGSSSEAGVVEPRSLYREFVTRMFDETTNYRTQIVALLAVFQYDIPASIVADVVGCSTGYARRFEYRPGTGVREKTWSRRQGASRVGPALRQRVLERDEFRCVRCGSNEEIVAHHIIPARQGGPPVLSNLATLCDRCHELAHDGVINSGEVFYDSTDQFWEWVRSR